MGKRIDVLIGKINDINKELKTWVSSPAALDANGHLVIHSSQMTKVEKEQIIKLINDLDYKWQVDTQNKLIEEKEGMEKKLKEYLK